MISKRKILTQLFREFWIPIALTILWTAYGLYSRPLAEWFTVTTINTAIVTFFSLSFFSAQWNRVKKQVEVKQGLSGIEEKVQGMLDNLDMKTADLVNHVTGGNSYCFLVVRSDGYATFSAVGAYPLYDLSVMILDEQKLTKKLATEGDAFTNAHTSFSLGTLRPNAFFAWPHRFNLGVEDVHHFTIQFHARNGIVSQHLQFRKKDELWKVATKVVRYDSTLTVLHEFSDSDFPRDKNGDIDWNYNKS